MSWSSAWEAGKRGEKKRREREEGAVADCAAAGGCGTGAGHAVDVAGFWLLGVLSGVCSLFVGSVTWVAVAGWTVAGWCLAVSAGTLAVVCDLAALRL